MFVMMCAFVAGMAIMRATAVMVVLGVTMIVIVVRVTAEHMGMAMPFPTELLNDVVKAEKNQCAARDPREPLPQFPTYGDAEPGDEKTEDRREQDVTGARERSDHECFCPVPFLDPRR